MRFESRIFQLAKDPEHPGEYQDACQVDARAGNRRHRRRRLLGHLLGAVGQRPGRGGHGRRPRSPTIATALAAWLATANARPGPSGSTPRRWPGSSGPSCPWGPFPRCCGSRSTKPDAGPARGVRGLSACGVSPSATVVSSTSAAASWCAASPWKPPPSSRPTRWCWAASI